MNRSEKIRASYVAIASVGENPRPQLDATSPEISDNPSERIPASYMAIASLGENQVSNLLIDSVSSNECELLGLRRESVS